MISQGNYYAFRTTVKDANPNKVDVDTAYHGGGNRAVGTYPVIRRVPVERESDSI
jgi:hypothetical protein